MYPPSSLNKRGNLSPQTCVFPVRGQDALKGTSYWWLLSLNKGVSIRGDAQYERRVQGRELSVPIQAAWRAAVAQAKEIHARAHKSGPPRSAQRSLSRWRMAVSGCQRANEARSRELGARRRRPSLALIPCSLPHPLAYLHSCIRVYSTRRSISTRIFGRGQSRVASRWAVRSCAGEKLGGKVFQGYFPEGLNQV